MITMLFAALCVAYGPGDECVDRQVFPAGMWEGPDAYQQCEDEARASRRRLQNEDLAHHFVLYCEITPAGE